MIKIRSHTICTVVKFINDKPGLWIKKHTNQIFGYTSYTKVREHEADITNEVLTWKIPSADTISPSATTMVFSKKNPVVILYG